MSVKILRLPKPSVARLGKTVRQPGAVPVQRGSVEGVKTKAENVCAASPERLPRLVRNSTRIDSSPALTTGLGRSAVRCLTGVFRRWPLSGGRLVDRDAAIEFQAAAGLPDKLSTQFPG